MELTKTKFKQTEVGLIPEDWEINELNNISKITRLAGYEYSTVWMETPNGEIIALRGFNIGENKIIKRDFVRISNKLSMLLIRSRLYKGDVIYPCVGTIGNAVVIEEDDKYHIQQNIAKITPAKDFLDSKYLAYYLMSSFGYDEIQKFNGSSSQPNILVGSLRKYSIISPPLPEQKAIAQVLSDTDALIQTLEQKLAKKRAIKQGAMQQLLTPKEGWERVKLSKVIEVNRGGSPRPIQDYITSSPSGINWIKIGDTSRTSKYIVSSEEKIIPEGIHNSRQVKVGDFLLSNSMSFGRPYILKIDGCIHDGWLVLQNYQDSFDREFLYYTLMSEDVFKQYLTKASGSGVLNLNKELVMTVELNRPKTLEEQTRIATILSDMDAEIAQLEQKLDKYKLLKQGLMQELLTGRIRLV